MPLPPPDSAAGWQLWSTRTVKPPPRPRERIPLSSWDVAMLSANYIQKGLLFTPPTSPPLLSTADVVDHLAASLAHRARNLLPGRRPLRHRTPPTRLTPYPSTATARACRSFTPSPTASPSPTSPSSTTAFFVGFVYNHGLSDGTAFWDFLNAWAEIARGRLASQAPGAEALGSSRRPTLFKRWSPDGAPVVLPYDKPVGAYR
ncbi:hypothetical protein GUJ93_ZPchr0007g4365 [Zizania palustris]|uniref:Acetyltransferase n=1 Tax=Zizania palustris TaxID=103762 RepID=A0A8J5VQA2_ZIZPA|nr:hypothetical protein GUJ93_ZPchr0007g4365 [Zizania palustris]